ncbi:DUF3820 family protein [Emticicia sp. CRIBPO]|uniref:DUF3820 family protein n=1 Tax=Emticicia sp. CRIBPO TaxID=2683258 RepID=UPI00197AA7BE|nr:DUF3820 family protein [Emticicia sp. CRIBPO]
MDNINKEILLEIIKVQMPFGKYKGTKLCDLPVSYLEWFSRQGGFPPGKLGMQLSTVYEIKINGLEEIIWKLKKLNP